MSAKSTAVVVEAVVANGKVRIVDDFGYRVRIQKAVKAWGDGCALVVRVEPEEEAAQHHQFKFLFGHLLTPAAEYTGYSKLELHWMAKSFFMPDGKTSLTELNRKELREYTEHVERWLREEIPDAFAIAEPMSA